MNATIRSPTWQWAVSFNRPYCAAPVYFMWQGDVGADLDVLQYKQEWDTVLLVLQLIVEL